MTPLNQPDRQKYHRIKFNTQVNIHPVIESTSGNVLEVPTAGYTVKSRDVSEGGIRLKMRGTDSPTKILKLNFIIQTSKTVDAYAKLVWKKGDLYGFQYIVLDDDSRGQIRDYVEVERQKTNFTSN